jgi:ribosomal-protein-alanine N-acetyltransferase
MSQFDLVSLLYAEPLSVLHKSCFEKYWDKNSFESLLRLPTTCGWMNEFAFILFSVCGEEAEILTLGVAPDVRKAGLATELLLYTFDQLKQKGVHAVFLDVSVENVAAIGLYNKMGFEQIALRKGYYTEKNHKVDALILKKQI